MHRRQFRHPRQGEPPLADGAQGLHDARVLPQADGGARESALQARLSGAPATALALQEVGQGDPRRRRQGRVAVPASTSGLTTLIGLPASKATIWSKTSMNCVSYSSRVT